MGYLQTAVTKYFGEGDNIPAIQNPLFRKGVSVPMDASGLHSAPLIILIQHMIRGAFGQLLSENIAEQENLHQTCAVCILGTLGECHSEFC